ncbi:MAG: hypothetical protein ACKVY0_25130 [Prosthecobacter sp.]|uniref:hypothetical protein n=1 Tax=Prosthecobacter sp. TaxID=1965333 RepID=UPI0038FDD7F7
MILILSGEGPSDIGSCNNGQGRCSGPDFRAGPMAMIVDKIAEDKLGYSLADAGALDHIPESSRARMAKQLPRTFVTGKRRGFETAHFFKEVRALARLAMTESEADETLRGVVLFHDSDGTRSTERGLYETRIRSMEDGFKAEGFEFGVPMVPRPKSEAWLICALKLDAYQYCEALEDSLSGNDNASEPAKEQLHALLSNTGKTVTDLADLVHEGIIDHGRISMPSYDAFKSRLQEVLASLQRQPATPC